MGATATQPLPVALPRWRAVRVRSVERALLFTLTLSGFIAFIEPSPYEYVFALVLAFFVMSSGLRFTPTMTPLLLCLVPFSIGGFICLMPFLGEKASVIFTIISAYMCVTTAFYAALLRVDPEGRLAALRDGYVLAAVLASIAGIIGYFNLFGLAESFTKFDRAAGTFKDPNVLGTFVILPLVYLVHGMWVDRVRPWAVIAAAVILFGGVFLSFSRGAWGCTVASIGLMTVLTYTSCGQGRIRRRIIVMTLAGVAFVTVALGVALSFQSVSGLFEERASLEQSYDTGVQGRFGNQIASIPKLIARPNGFGPLRFRDYFPEDPHDVFINAFASYGWLGGFSYLVLIVLTLSVGWRMALRPSPLRQHAIVIWSVLFIEILQGFQIDTDHWRHFWLMTGLIWGLLAARPSPPQPASPRAASPRP